MSEIQVKTSLRKRKRELKNALGDDILRYIAELVTNADDSYKRLGNKAKDEKIIVIKLKKDKRNKDSYILSVTDNAEGMSITELKNKFGTYGGDNAKGLEFNARGIFGQGASDVLRAAAREHRIATIESIKDGIVSKLTYKMDEELNASINPEILENLSGNRLQQFRNNLKIPNNGTRVTFGIPSNVKLNSRIISNLPELINKYYSFRYLLNQDDRKVIFINDEEEYKLSSIKYQFKNENLISDDYFSFTFDGSNVNCNLKLYKNVNKNEDGTKIIVRDENYVVYDNTMFDFQNNASAQNISGELIINELYKICFNHLNSDDPDAIINDNRTGFDTKNSFYIKLNKAINPYIDKVLKENGKDIKITNLNNNKKFNEALKKLNKYLKSELKEPIEGGPGIGKVPPLEGIKFVRNNMTVTKNKQYDLKLMINSNIISTNENIKIVCDDENIEFSPSTINYNENDVEDGMAIKSVTIKGLDLTNDSVIMQAQVEGRIATVAIDVIDLEIHYPNNGIEFYPNDIALTVNKSHFIKLYVDSSIVPIGEIIRIECDGLICDSIVKFTEKDLINDSIGVIKVVLKGGKLKNSYYVKAIYNDIETTAKITMIEEAKNEPQNGGIISGFKLEPSNLAFQSYYDPHTHFIVINNNNPINIRIMGEMLDKDENKPTFNPQQSRYLCDIISNQAAILLVKQKNIKNGEVNFEDFENAIEHVQNLIQQQKNKIYIEIYPAIMGIAKEEN